jgi:hypothetical protein
MDAFANVEMYAAYEEAKLNPDAYEVKLFQGLNGKKFISQGKRLLSGITALSILGVVNSSVAHPARVNLKYGNIPGNLLHLRQYPGSDIYFALLSDYTQVNVRGLYDDNHLLIEYRDSRGLLHTGTVPKNLICDGGADYIPTCPKVKFKQVLKSKELKESFEKFELKLKTNAIIKLQHPDVSGNYLQVYSVLDKNNLDKNNLDKNNGKVLKEFDKLPDATKIQLLKYDQEVDAFMVKYKKPIGSREHYVVAYIKSVGKKYIRPLGESGEVAEDILKRIKPLFVAGKNL